MFCCGRNRRSLWVDAETWGGGCQYQNSNNNNTSSTRAATRSSFLRCLYPRKNNVNFPDNTTTTTNSDEDREARVDELLGVLGLEACSEVRVGNPLERGISGGEARRLSMGIGVADLESVRLLLLDEPTTVRHVLLPCCFSAGELEEGTCCRCFCFRRRVAVVAQ